MARSKKFERNDNNLAIAYYRFSSHVQNEASIDQQRELAHAWAEANGFKIVREYEDAAISGTLEERPGFQQMLSEVGKIKPNTLVLWKTDRLGRDRYVLSMAKHAIRKAGCGIHLLAEAIPTETPEGVLMEGMMESFAEYYSLQLSMNVRRGMMYNAQNALYNGNKLFGYDVDKATKKYVVDEATAPFVQRMFSEYAEGVPMQDIAEELNGSGVRTVRGREFTVKALNKMLKNRAYIGEYHHSGVVVEGGMPALVDEETFERVQARMTLNKRHGSQRARGKGEDGAPRYWLTGKLYCGECGARMQGMYGTGKMENGITTTTVPTSGESFAPRRRFARRLLRGWSKSCCGRSWRIPRTWPLLRWMQLRTIERTTSIRIIWKGWKQSARRPRGQSQTCSR